LDHHVGHRGDVQWAVVVQAFARLEQLIQDNNQAEGSRLCLLI
jgi:hypothetical protein